MLRFKNIQDFNNSVGHKLCSTEKPPHISESQLQEQIVDYLLSSHIFCFSVPNGFYGGKDKIKVAQHVAKLKKQGLRAGVSDLIVLLPSGRAIFLELKVGSNKQQPSQLLFQKNVEELGFKYHLVKEIEKIELLIKEWRNDFAY